MALTGCIMPGNAWLAKLEVIMIHLQVFPKPGFFSIPSLCVGWVFIAWVFTSWSLNGCYMSSRWSKPLAHFTNISEISSLTFIMLETTSVTKFMKQPFQWKHTQKVQTDLSAVGNVFKKLKHCSFIIGCRDIHWSVHLLEQQQHTLVNISIWNKARPRVILRVSWEYRAPSSVQV